MPEERQFVEKTLNGDIRISVREDCPQGGELPPLLWCLDSILVQLNSQHRWLSWSPDYNHYMQRQNQDWKNERDGDKPKIGVDICMSTDLHEKL